MVAIPLPTSTAPGAYVQESGGRLINCYAERLADTAGSRMRITRAPGLVHFDATPEEGGYRGGIAVGSTFFSAWDSGAVYAHTAGATGGVELSGTLPGLGPVFMAHNNKSTPDVVAVAPGEGAFVISPSAVSAYPDADVGQPNSVVYHKGHFAFTYGNGQSRTSGVNSTNINTLDFATAESRPDGLYCAVPLGSGQILLVGSSTMEAWGGQNDTGYPWTYVQTISRGIVGPFAIAGHQDGFGKGIFLVGDDNRVHRIEGYQTVPISPPDLDRLIQSEPNKALIQVSVFVADGHGMVMVQAPSWTWVYDLNTESWHERQSHLRTRWRGILPVRAFDRWLVGDRESGNLLAIDPRAQQEVDDPLRMRIDTGPIGNYPNMLRINRIELMMTKGVGIAEGHDPTQTRPTMAIGMSPDGGINWRNSRVVDIGSQALGRGRVATNNLGRAHGQGVRFRFDISDPVPVSIMAADVQIDVLR